MRIPGLLLSIALLLQVGGAFAESAAKVVFATGAPTVIGADGVARALARGDEVAAGETIDTADGRVQLRFLDGASMSLQPATRFRVDDYRFAGEGGQADAGNKSFFSLLKGGLRTISGLIGKGRREQYRVDTVVATIGIRGTEYGANLADDGLRVTTFAGLVEVCNRGGCQLVRPGETALADHAEHKPRLLGARAVLPGSAELLPQLQTPTAQQEVPAGGTSPQPPASSTVSGYPSGPSTAMPAGSTSSVPSGATMSAPTGSPTGSTTGSPTGASMTAAPTASPTASPTGSPTGGGSLSVPPPR